MGGGALVLVIVLWSAYQVVMFIKEVNELRRADRLGLFHGDPLEGWTIIDMYLLQILDECFSTFNKVQFVPCFTR